MTQRAFEIENPERIAEMLKALSHSMRLRIFKILAQGPQKVTSLTRRLVVPSCSVSHHVRILQVAHVLRSKRLGTYMMYDLVCPELVEVISNLELFSDPHQGGVPPQNTL